MACKVLGISAYFHDASAALIVDSELVAAAAEERFTGLKHDPNFPSSAIEFCLDAAGIRAGELDAVVFYEDPSVKFSRVLVSALAGFPCSRNFYANAMKVWLKDRLWTTNNIAAELGVALNVVRTVSHHESHVAQAFATAPVEEAAVLTVDAVGEWTTTSISRASRRAEPVVCLIEKIEYPHSLGLVYAAFTLFLGFRPNDQEANTMALAAFGTPRFADRVRRIIHLRSDGWFDIASGYFDFLKKDDRLFKRPFIDLFGPPRDARRPLTFDVLSDRCAVPNVANDGQRYVDIAASVQQVFEEAVLGLAARARELTGSTSLCLSGGGALNVLANSRIIGAGLFEDVFVPSDPGDGGGAVGAAWLGTVALTGRAPVLSGSPYLGKAYPQGLEPALVERLDPTTWTYGVAPGFVPPAGLTRTDCDSLDELVALVAEELRAGRIVGWVQGRFEFGPRALGARSILADPSNLETVRRLSHAVKQRASYRPYALSIRERDVTTVFDWQGAIPDPARRMKMVMRVRPHQRRRIAGALHVDGSCRLHAVSPLDNARFYALLDRIATITGLGAVLNTSFNEADYPMVASPTEALMTFARCDMDTIAVGQSVLRKQKDCAANALETAAPKEMGVGGRPAAG